MLITVNGLFDPLLIQTSKTALIVVDVQNDFCHKDGVFSKVKKVDLDYVEKAVKNLSAFIETCRQLKLPIVFIKTTHSPWTDSPSWPVSSRTAP